MNRPWKYINNNNTIFLYISFNVAYYYITLAMHTFLILYFKRFQSSSVTHAPTLNWLYYAAHGIGVVWTNNIRKLFWICVSDYSFSYRLRTLWTVQYYTLRRCFPHPPFLTWSIVLYDIIPYVYNNMTLWQFDVICPRCWIRVIPLNMSIIPLQAAAECGLQSSIIGRYNDILLLQRTARYSKTCHLIFTFWPNSIRMKINCLARSFCF